MAGAREKWTAVVLAGGEGRRLRPLTERVPKPMLPLLGRPLLSYTFDSLAAAGVERAVLACGYLPDHVHGHYGHRYDGISLEYVHEREPLGTGGGIRFAAGGADRTFLALNGDTVREAQISALLDFHRETHAEATVLLVRVPDPARYGLVRVGDDGRVRGFLEKPSPEQIDTDLVNAGVYVLEPGVLDLIPPGRAVSIERDVFPLLVERGTLFGLCLPGYWLDIGTPASYLQAHVDLLERSGGVELAAGAEISAGAEVVPPVIAADGAVVEAGARLGPHAYLAHGARLCASSVLERAATLPRAVVEPGLSVRSAIVSPDCTLACA
ncbi:MAG: nucleotidyltransferase family protein [Gaiellaceae bacterium]